MANYNDLKTGIDAVIKTNGRQEISGAALNTALNNMITELGAGYQYMGIATPATNPGTPDANVFYLASEAGTYTNFRGIVINEGEVCALVWNGTWTKEVTGIASADKLNQLGQELSHIQIPDSISIIPVSTFMQKLEKANYRNAFIAGNIGEVIQPSPTFLGNDIRTAELSLNGVLSVEFPVFQTSGGYGSFIIDSNSLVVASFVNTQRPTGGTILVDTASYSSGGYKFLISIYPFSTSGDNIIKIYRANGSHSTEVLNDYIIGLGKDNLSFPGQNKFLSTLGVSVLSKRLSKLSQIVGTEKNVTQTYTIVSGKQAYGNIGSVISIASMNQCEYCKIDASSIPAGSKLLVSIETLPNVWQISSYVQFVNSSNIITRRLFVGADAYSQFNFIVEFEENEVSVYVTSASKTIKCLLFDDSNVGDSIIESIQEIESSVGELAEEVDGLVVDSAVSVQNLSVNGAMCQFENAAFRDRFISGETGEQIVLSVQSSSNNVRTAVIPLDGVLAVTFPVFQTTSGFGSFIVDSNMDVVVPLVNTEQPSGEYITVDTRSYTSGGYKILISIYPFSTSTGSLIKIHRKNDVIAKKRITPILPFRYFGNMPSCLSSDGNSAFLPDGVDGNGDALISYADVISKYDELMAAYPTYITKNELGYDASGTIKIYSYTFAPKYWKQSIFLQAGVHGWEPDAVFALAEMMFLISNAYGNAVSAQPYKENDEILLWLRGNVKFTIVPVVNPYGFNDRGNCEFSSARRGEKNYNNVNLANDWNSASPQPECAYVNSILQSLKDELSFSMDMHSTVHDDSRTRYGCFFGCYVEGAQNVLTIMRTYEWLYRYYNVQYPTIVDGESAPNPLGGGYASIGKSSSGFPYWSLLKYGIPSSIIELCDHVWTSGLHTSVALSVAVTMYLNQIIQQICDEYVLSGVEELPAGDTYLAKG